MRITDIMMAFPTLLLAMALVAILKPSVGIIIGVIGLVYWTWIARVIYGQVLVLREREFVTAATALGTPRRRILFRHILPHLVPTIIVWGTLGIATNVMLEASLSYLGIGVQPPIPSWGGMIQQGQAYYRTAPWLVVVPGLAIMVTVFAFNLLGDGLRDALDPMQRERRLPCGVSSCAVCCWWCLSCWASRLITFILIYYLPADPARMYAGPSATVETVARIRHELGLDLPLWQQYVNYIGNVLQGDLGFSYRKQEPVLQLILSRLPYTFALIAAGIFVELAMGLPIGIASAVARGRWPDRAGMFVALLGVSAPAFWLGLMLLYLFAYQIPIFPLGGATEPLSIVLPAITAGLAARPGTRA